MRPVFTRHLTPEGGVQYHQRRVVAGRTFEHVLNVSRFEFMRRRYVVAYRLLRARRELRAVVSGWAP